MRNNRTRRVRMTESDLRRLVRRVINETNHSEMDKMEMADGIINKLYTLIVLKHIC